MVGKVQITDDVVYEDQEGIGQFFFKFNTLSEQIAQSTIYHHLLEICAYLRFTIMHKVIGVTRPLSF